MFLAVGHYARSSRPGAKRSSAQIRRFDLRQDRVSFNAFPVTQAYATDEAALESSNVRRGPRHESQSVAFGGRRVKRGT